MSAKKTILSRPRTRLYDSNYHMGESYYKPALDRIDRKYSGRPLTPPRQTNSFGSDIAERHARLFAEEDLETSRRRAEKHIREDHLFDSRGGRIGRGASILDGIENGFNEEPAVSSIKSLRAKKKVTIVDDVHMENTSNQLKTHRLLNRSDKILDTVGIREKSPYRALEDDFSEKRVLRVTKDKEPRDDYDIIHKWTPIEPNISSSVRVRKEEVVSVRARHEDTSIDSTAAAFRAKRTKERLNDLEEEMNSIAEKQAAREARVARLRALVAETEAESEQFERDQVKAERASARKERGMEY